MFTALLAGLVLLAPAVGASGIESWKFEADPMTTDGAQVITGRGETTAPLECIISELTLASSQTLIRFPLPTDTSVSVTVPSAGRETFVELDLRERGGTETLFQWRTVLLKRREKMADYRGPDGFEAPEDFEKYWERAKNELAAVPMNAVVTRVPDRDTSTGLLHKVILDTVGDTKIACWYFVPRSAHDSDAITTAPCAAMIIMPGYGAEEPPIDRTSSGVITLSVNPRNHGPSKEYWESPIDHRIHGIDDPAGYYYKLAFLDCLRAAEFLFGRPECDGARVAAEGGSQGGLFAIALAALEPRIKCVASNVPGFSAYSVGMALASRGHHAQFRELLKESFTTATEVKKSLAYTDGANMARLVKVPTQVNMGGLDPVCPFPCGAVIINRLPEGVEREYNIDRDAGHAVPPEMRDHNARWYEKHLGVR